MPFFFAKNPTTIRNLAGRNSAGPAERRRREKNRARRCFVAEAMCLDNLPGLKGMAVRSRRKFHLTVQCFEINLSASVDRYQRSHREWLRDWPCETTATGRSASAASRCQIQPDRRRFGKRWEESA